MAIQALASLLLIMLSTSTPISGATPFNPTLEWTCELSSIFVAIRTSSPFNGIAHSKGESLNCTAYGNGTTLTKMVIPLGADNNQCGVKFNKDTGLYWVDIEVHEHKLLILEQDRIFNVTCDKKNAVSLKIGDDDGDHLIANDDNNNSTEIASTSSSDSILLLPTIEFNLELVPNLDTDDSKMFESLSDHDVGYGQSYNMNISFKSEADKYEYGNRFRATHCVAESDDIAVELVDSHGCSIDKKLMTDFVYKDGYATAKIPSMFRFPNSKTMKLECKLSICQDFQLCRPSCDRKMDDPIAEVEDAEMIAHLLGMDDESVQTAVTGPMQSGDNKPTKSTSTIVHVLDRREIPLRNDVTLKPGNGFFPTSTECFASEEILTLYAILFGLALALALSLVVNIWCCICCRRKKTKNDGRRQSYLIQNECWITGNPTVEMTKDINQETALAVYLAQRRPSVSSYATVKQRFSTRPISHSTPIQCMEMQEPSTTFRPISQAPSPPQPVRLSVYELPSQNMSTFRQSVSADSSSGTSTWSPGRNSQVDTSREASSIL